MKRKTKKKRAAKKRAAKKVASKRRGATIHWAGLSRHFDDPDAAETFRLGLIKQWPILEGNINVRGD